VLLLGCQSQSVPTVSPSEHSLKGWQLYSWQEGGDWHFVLYPSTNALKKASEIKAAGDKATGVDNLKRELARMPRGEILFWSNGQMSDFTLPPGEIVVDVAQFCAEHGIQLTMTLGG
jgi:hypothetical protein